MFVNVLVTLGGLRHRGLACRSEDLKDFNATIEKVFRQIRVNSIKSSLASVKFLTIVI